MKATEREQKIDELWADVAMPVQNVILNATNLVARENARHRDSAFWLEVGKGWVEIRDEALRRAETQNIRHPRYRYYHGLLMAKAPDLAALEEHDHAGCRHAVWLFENWAVIEHWLADREIGKNLRGLNHPSVIKRRFEAAHLRKPQGLKKPPPAAARMKARIDELEAENRKLRAALRRGSEMRRDDEPLPRDAAASAAIEQLIAAFGIDGEDKDRLFDLMIAREWAYVLDDPLGAATVLVGKIGIDAAEAYVEALEQAVRYADTEARKPRLRRRKTAPEPPPARPLLRRPV
jgi:hypothetical protein